MKPATVSPFPMPARKKAVSEPIDVDMLKIEHNTPLPQRIQKRRKYDHLFEKLKPGSCVVCERKEADPISTAMRGWIKRTDKKGFYVEARRNCKDGQARVWLMKK